MDEARSALIIASSSFEDGLLRRLEAPPNDARALAGALGDPAIGAFAVTTLTDPRASEAMQKLEEFFDNRGRGDLLFVYFSGHGILDEASRLYFATADTRTDRPRSTAIPASFVHELMTECRSRRQVLVLDCCNSGAFARGSKAGGSIGTKARLQGRGRIVITASDALQYAFEGVEIKGEPVKSVFTRALVAGLETGEADLNRDGRVSLDELYDYVYDRVIDESPAQRPGKWSFEVEGQIFIARAPGRETGDGASHEAITEHRPVAATRTAVRRRVPRVWLGAAAAVVVAVVVVIVIVLGSSSTAGPNTASHNPSNPRDAAISFLDAWRSGDRQAAQDVARTGAVDALFRLHYPATGVQSQYPCVKAGTGQFQCEYAYFSPSGSKHLMIHVGQYGSAFRVTDVTFPSD